MLFDKLKEYAASGMYPMHMPGHKRNTAFLPPGLPYDIDITEVHGFDDLHEPTGILLETAELAAELYGSKRAFLLVGGSTAGNLAAIGANTVRGDKILMDINCHRSIYNAVELFGLKPIYIIPETDETTGISSGTEPRDVTAALEKDPEIRLVVITSPTYEGVISDVGAISETVHGFGIPLFVDGAHGAHLDFSARFKGGAVRAGADAVVMSLHKTLPALTQCSLLHICSERVSITKVARLLSILQTSSPSYILMASIDRCLRLLSSDKERLFRGYESNLDDFSDEIGALKKLIVVNHGKDKNNPRFYAFDPGKLVIVTKNTAISGVELAETLRKDYQIELEMSRPFYAVAMTSICDAPEGFDRLAKALIEIDQAL